MNKIQCMQIKEIEHVNYRFKIQVTQNLET